MATIISPDDFEDEQNIPNTDETPIANKVQWFINEYEPNLLEVLLGSELYADFKSGLNDDPIEQKWIDLRDNADLKRAIVCYVYYYFVSGNVNFLSGANTVSQATMENATSGEVQALMVKAWNTMVNRNIKVRDFISTDEYETNLVDLPQYVWELPFVNRCRPDIFIYKNSLGL
jgi:hypothetical protein